MKRQTQEPGVRRWFGDDLLELQKESLKAIDAVVSMIEKPFAVNGCRVVSGGIEKGFVALEKDGGMKIMPFLGTNIVGTCYIVPTKREIKTPYADDVARCSAVVYEAVAQKTKPTSGSYLEVLANGKVTTFKEAIQDTSHKFVSDTERNIWNSKETPSGSQTKADSALNDAKIYAKAKADSALNDAKADAQTKATNAYYSANTVAQQKADKALSDAKGYTNTKASDAELSAKRYALGRCDTLESNKADKSDVIINEGEVNLFPFGNNSYANRIINNDGGTQDDRGLIAQFCAGDNGLAIQYHKGKDRFLISKMTKRQNPPYPNGQTPPPYYYWERFALIHTGNIVAGRVSGSGYTPHIGRDMNPNPSGSTYTFYHYLSSSGYSVSVTPIGSTTKSYTILEKTSSKCVIKLSSPGDFEVQFMKYR